MSAAQANTNSRELNLLRTYFKTSQYPFTSHHINSFDLFLKEGLPSILRARNPLTIVKEQIPGKEDYKYMIEIYLGGISGDGIYIGTPTVSLQDSDEVRLLFPNEARLRNLTYGSTILLDVHIKITRKQYVDGVWETLEPEIIELKYKNETEDSRIPLCKIPILLHSQYCLLHGKPEAFLEEVGECIYDYGGYFIVEGSEKVLVTRQEQAFNTLYISNQLKDPKIKQFASITSLSPSTRMVKYTAFTVDRLTNRIRINLPMVRLPIPVFVAFRAMGIQSDKDILRLIFPDMYSAEAKILSPLLLASIQEALPFTDTPSAINFIKSMTKGFSIEHVLDILQNQLFVHIEDKPGARAAFLGDCVRSILRVNAGLDQPTNRDDIRNQRCLTSGFALQMLFQGIYTRWLKAVGLNIDKEYNYKSNIYANENFKNIFLPANIPHLFAPDLMNESIMRAFKGKWGSGIGEEKQGVLQALSRLSYHDFLSHCRRVVLDFDTGMKLPGPRRLNPSQYGYFCTSETPTGASIGITKNLSILTKISTATDPGSLQTWLYTKGTVISCIEVNDDTRSASIPVFLNGGILGYTQRPEKLRDILKLLKWTGCLPSYCSIGFSIEKRRIFIYLDEGRPLRPLIHVEKGGRIPAKLDTFLDEGASWRKLVMGTLPETQGRDIYSTGFVDPLASKANPTLEEYEAYLTPHIGVIEYVDPYEHNETYIANFPTYMNEQTSHLEIHPSTILGLMTNMIPFANHNQSPRNQLSCSQSKQGLSIYSTKYPSRYDNQAHVLCYGEAPLTRTLYYDYVADGNIGYGHNLILAIGSFTGYNQDDGIVMNKDALDRGMFRSMAFRSYEAFEEDDEETGSKTRIANPKDIPGWTDVKPGLDYKKLDEKGIIRVGEYVDENTVIVSRYILSRGGSYNDLSVTPQVWTRGRVDKVVVTVNNNGLRLIKIRVVHDRIPELGDKFSNRHGQKGTIGMKVNGVDMPRTAEGIVPDMIMNPHAIPSRMTIAQLLETIFGKAASYWGAIANATSFMNDGDPSEIIGKLLQELGMEKYGNEILYDGTTGVQIPSAIFIGQCYTMRLKHMTEDKWNARAEGRREQRTHQPTGGRGNEGGLRIGEMERDAIAGHGVSLFLRESMMKRGDGTNFIVCNGCGTIPIYNEKESFYVCPLCDGPVSYSGSTAKDLELTPPIKRSLATFSKVEMPYVVKLLEQELSTYMNIGMRLMTNKNLQILRKPPLDIEDKALVEYLTKELPQTVLELIPDPVIKPKEPVVINSSDLANLGAALPKQPGEDVPLEENENETKEEEFEKEAGDQAPVASALRMEGGAVNVAPAPAPVAPMVVPTVTTVTTTPAAPPAAPQTIQIGGQQGVLTPQAQQISVQTAPMMMPYQQMMMPMQQPMMQQPMMPMQQQMMQQQMMPQAMMMNTVIPGAPPTFVVDTSPQAMMQSGFEPVQNTNPSGGGQRNRTQRQHRSGGMSQGPSQSQAPAPSPSPSANVRVTVQKLG
jgi:DNA-directed RNA polymerase II subunit RPB2